MNRFSTVLAKKEREREKEKTLASNVNRAVEGNNTAARLYLRCREVCLSAHASLNDVQIDARNATTRRRNVQELCSVRPQSANPEQNPPGRNSPAIRMNARWWLGGRDDREWPFTFPLPPILVQSIPIPSHSHSRTLHRCSINYFWARED